MAFLRYNGKIVVSEGKYIVKIIPSENPALSRLQSFWVAVNAYYVDWNELPTTQLQLESYMSFAPDGAYTFSFTSQSATFCYFQATSSNEFIHSYTRTVVDEGGSFEEIICKKLGTTAPGPADYTGGNLSCQTGTIEV
jgi:hypothetical protein